MANKTINVTTLDDIRIEVVGEGTVITVSASDVITSIRIMQVFMALVEDIARSSITDE